MTARHPKSSTKYDQSRGLISTVYVCFQYLDRYIQMCIYLYSMYLSIFIILYNERWPPQRNKGNVVVLTWYNTDHDLTIAASSDSSIINSFWIFRQPQGVWDSTNICSSNRFCRKPWQIQKSVCPVQTTSQHTLLLLPCVVLLCARDLRHVGLTLNSKLLLQRECQHRCCSQGVSHAVVYSSQCRDWTPLQFHSTTIHSFEFRRPQKWDFRLFRRLPVYLKRAYVKK